MINISTGTHKYIRFNIYREKFVTLSKMRIDFIQVDGKR